MRKYSHSGEGFERDWSPDNPWQGPHQDRELQMMLAGVKPVAIIERHRYKRFLHRVLFEDWVSIPLGGRHRAYEDYIVSLPDEAWRARKLYKLFQEERRDHLKIGLLLGYTKEHVKAWCDAHGRFR